MNATFLTNDRLAELARKAERQNPLGFDALMGAWRDSLNHTGTYNPIADAPGMTLRRLDPTELDQLVSQLARLTE